MRAGGGMTNDETKGKKSRRDLVMGVDGICRVAEYGNDSLRYDLTRLWMHGWI